MVDVLLIQPPIRDFYLTAGRTLPYGLACIASALMKEGFTVQILDCLATSRSRRIVLPHEMDYLQEYYGKPDVSPFGLFHGFKHYGYSFEHVGRAAKESGAFLVGVSSLFTAYSEEALETARVVKEVHPGCKVVLGGHHPTELPEDVMACEAVDYVVRGEGEISLPRLARALKAGHTARSVPGIVFRDPEAEKGIVISPPALMTDLDTHAPPALHLVNNHFYRRAKRGSAVVAASRGCPMKCSYCSVSSSSHVKYRRRSVESVLREIEEGVLHRDVRFIDFEDENISLEREWFLDLLTRVSERFGHLGLELRAMNGLFAPSLDEEVIRSMKDAGFRTLNLSLGTTSVAGQRRFRRPDVRGAFEEALENAGKWGLNAVAYIIVGAPGQDPGDSISDLLYLAVRRALVGVSVYYPSPGSLDYTKCREAGVLPARYSLMRATAIPISHTTTRVESVTLLRLGRIVNYMKSLLDTGETLPEPAPCAAPSTAPPTAKCTAPRELEAPPGVIDRRAMGRALLQWFLHDGKIRGVTPDGQVFEHRISESLTRSFLAGLAKDQISGWQD